MSQFPLPFAATAGVSKASLLLAEGWLGKAWRSLFSVASHPLSDACPTLTLADAKPGQTVLLKAVRDNETEMTLLRVGLSLGQTVLVLAKPPGGPVVLQQDGLELALGHMYAAAIDISLV